MRAFTGGYYKSLMAMYSFLGIRWRQNEFRYIFASDSKAYFIHASDNHEIPPPRPREAALWAYLLELCLVVVCFPWFTICCHWIPALSTEIFDDYLQRIRLPQMFVSKYLLPLFSAIATCSHQELLQFPANDVVHYRKLITLQKHFLIEGGIAQVEQKLAQNLEVRLGTRVVRVEPKSDGVEIFTDTFDVHDQEQQVVELFDQVVIAVSPDVVAAIFEPASKQMGRIPVRKLETIVHYPQMENTINVGVDQILLSTSRADGWTEATHVQRNGLAVTSLPNGPGKQVLSRSVFTRTLRTPASRRVVQEVFADTIPKDSCLGDEKSWRNGDNGVWLAGAWCWDGMVLLEGAVVSAERIAHAFDLDIPWKRKVG